LKNLARDGDVWRLVTGEGDLAARALVLATGASLKELGVPGEARLRGQGVSHCASCDAPLLRGKTAAVIGGGDSAMQEALTLSQHVSQVVLLTHGAALTGQMSYRERVTQDPKIEVRTRTEVEDILGDAKVAGLRLRDVGSGAASDLNVDAVFVYIGLAPNTGFLGGHLNLSAGAIPTDAFMRTALPGVCAAGTVRAGSACRAAGAAGDGATAAIAIDRYLTDGVWRGEKTEALAH
jgi:thioredoxin reductase (NADPH)